MKKEKIYGICALVLLVDQIIKVVVTLKMKLGQALPVLPSFFEIQYVQNTGAAFSILEGSRYLLIVFAILVFFALQRYIRKSTIKNKMEMISLGLLMGGLVGNLVDRILYGYVIDYLSFHFSHFSFPIFNLADIAVVLGVFLMSIGIFSKEK